MMSSRIEFQAPQYPWSTVQLPSQVIPVPWKGTNVSFMSIAKSSADLEPRITTMIFLWSHQERYTLWTLFGYGHGAQQHAAAENLVYVTRFVDGISGVTYWRDSQQI